MKNNDYRGWKSTEAQLVLIVYFLSFYAFAFGLVSESFLQYVTGFIVGGYILARVGAKHAEAKMITGAASTYSGLPFTSAQGSTGGTGGAP